MRPMITLIFALYAAAQDFSPGFYHRYPLPKASPGLSRLMQKGPVFKNLYFLQNEYPAAKLAKYIFHSNGMAILPTTSPKNIVLLFDSTLILKLLNDDLSEEEFWKDGLVQKKLQSYKDKVEQITIDLEKMKEAIDKKIAFLFDEANRHKEKRSEYLEEIEELRVKRKVEAAKLKYLRSLNKVDTNKLKVQLKEIIEITRSGMKGKFSKELIQGLWGVFLDPSLRVSRSIGRKVRDKELEGYIVRMQKKLKYKHPPLLDMKSVIVSKDKFLDCAESNIRSILNILFFDENKQEFVVHSTNDEKIKEFYTKYPTVKSQEGISPAQEFAEIMSKRKGVYYNKYSNCELKSNFDSTEKIFKDIFSIDNIRGLEKKFPNIKILKVPNLYGTFEFEKDGIIYSSEFMSKHVEISSNNRVDHQLEDRNIIFQDFIKTKDIETLALYSLFKPNFDESHRIFKDSELSFFEKITLLPLDDNSHDNFVINVLNKLDLDVFAVPIINNDIKSKYLNFVIDRISDEELLKREEYWTPMTLIHLAVKNRHYLVSKRKERLLEEKVKLEDTHFFESLIDIVDEKKIESYLPFIIENMDKISPLPLISLFKTFPQLGEHLIQKIKDNLIPHSKFRKIFEALIWFDIPFPFELLIPHINQYSLMTIIKDKKDKYYYLVDVFLKNNEDALKDELSLLIKESNLLDKFSNIAQLCESTSDF